ncbi:MAG: polyprenyl synthetase family protein [Planctomycetes bacterium]|nr:polyprenyl synthetase family protein [Planctomycetota bacterium]
MDTERPAPSTAGVGVLKELYGPIHADIDRVEALLRAELRSENPFLASLVSHSQKFQGKRMRSAMLLYSARLCGGVTDLHVALAGVVELLHSATLVHDDVLDEAQLRRQVDTLNRRWGNETSVLFGDYLFAKAFILCSRLNHHEANRILGRTAQDMCEGELSQIATKFDPDIDEERYLRIIELKTARLFSTACRLGSLGWESDPAQIEALSSYGLNFGIAFQIIDDVLDITGEEAEVGKSLGTDLSKGKLTLPVIRLLRNLSGSDGQELRALIASSDNLPEKRTRILGLIRQGDIVAACLRRAGEFLDAARRALRPLGDSPETAALLELGSFALHRRA